MTMPTGRDVHFSIFMLVVVVEGVTAYLLRAAVAGRARHPRTESDGGSRFLNKAAMEMGYWMLAPVTSALVALRVTPNMVTLFSLLPALGAAVALGLGWFGLGCALATASSL